MNLKGVPFKNACGAPLCCLPWLACLRECLARAFARLLCTARQLPERLPAPARCLSSDSILLFCASQRWPLQQSKVISLCKPEPPASSSQFVKVRAARSLRAPLRCLTMCLCVLCPPGPCLHALLPLLLVWRASPCGHAAHARVRARLVCFPPAASPPVPCFIPARGG